MGRAQLRAVDGLHTRAKTLSVPAEYASCVAPAVPAPVLRRWYTTAQAAEYLGTTSKAISHHVAKGHLEPAVRGRTGKGRQHLFDREALDAFVLGRDTRRHEQY